MGYYHSWHGSLDIDPGTFAAIGADFKKLILPLADLGCPIAGPLGTGGPEITDRFIQFNGIRHCGHKGVDGPVVVFPTESARGIDACTTARWINTPLMTFVTARRCDGECCHDDFALGLHYPSGCCKTAFKPYDVAVTAALLVGKRHLGEGIEITSCGSDMQWLDAKLICQRVLGYGMAFRNRDPAAALRPQRAIRMDQTKRFGGDFREEQQPGGVQPTEAVGVTPKESNAALSSKSEPTRRGCAEWSRPRAVPRQPDRETGVVEARSRRMRVPCYFAELVPDSRFSMWLFGSLTDRHPACPSGMTVVAGFENELYVPEACGRVEVFDPGEAHPAVTRLLEQAAAAGYRVRKRDSVTGDELPEPDTAVEPFVVHEGSLLSRNPGAPIFRLLAGPDRVFEGKDGELYVQTTGGRWFHYLDEQILGELQRYGR